MDSKEALRALGGSLGGILRSLQAAMFKRSQIQTANVH